MTNNILKVQFRWSYLQWIMLTFMMIFIILLPLFAFDKDDSIELQIIYYLLFSSLAVISIILFFVNYQIAVITEESITISCKLYRIKQIKWKEIQKIKVEKLPTGTAGFSVVYKDWIVVYTNRNEIRNHGGINKRSKGPWYIYLTDYNFKIIEAIAKRHSLRIE